MALAAFKAATTPRPMVMLHVFLLSHLYLRHLADPDNCGWTYLYLPFTFLSGSLLLNAVAALMITFCDVMETISAEAMGDAARRKLRTLLLLASSLSCAATILAIVTFDFGTCVVIFGWPAWVMVSIMVLLQGLCASLVLVMALDSPGWTRGHPYPCSPKYVSLACYNG